MNGRGDVTGPIVLAVIGILVCAVTIWRDWSPVVWWIGTALLLIALAMVAWRWQEPHRRPRRIVAAIVVGLALAAVPVADPAIRPRAEVAWSVEGSEVPFAELGSGDTGGDTILTSDDGGALRARRADDGVVAWQYRTPEPQAEDWMVEIDVTEDVVLIGTYHVGGTDQELAALDAASGEELWTSPESMRPVVHDGSVLVVSAIENRQELLRGIDLEDGSVLWETEGSLGAKNSVRMGTPSWKVPVGEWLAEPARATDDDESPADFRVTEVTSGEQHLVTGPGGEYYAPAAVFGDRLVVHPLQVDPRGTPPAEDTVTTEVNAYALPGGTPVWTAELDFSWLAYQDNAMDYDLGSSLPDVDGTHLAGRDGGHLDLLDLRDGDVAGFDVPSEGLDAQVFWSGGGVALVRSDRGMRVLDPDGGDATTVAEDDAPRNESTTTAWLGHTPVPVWQEDAEGLFGCEYTTLGALDVRDTSAPERIDLGALPEGNLAESSYAGRLVVIESEEITDAPDGEEDRRTAAMHVLAPLG